MDAPTEQRALQLLGDEIVAEARLDAMESELDALEGLQVEYEARFQAMADKGVAKDSREWGAVQAELEAKVSAVIEQFQALPLR